MQDHLPWLCQGDVFQVLPQIFVEFDDAGGGRVRPIIEPGPAMLVTHDCDLDKPTSRAGDAQPRIDWLQFLPLRDLSLQPEDRQRHARNQQLHPPAVFYVDSQVEGVGEAFGLLSEMYSLPSAYFSLELKMFDDHDEAEPGTRHLVARRHGNRLGRVSPDQVQMLHRKMIAFWPRAVEQDAS